MFSRTVNSGGQFDHTRSWQTVCFDVAGSAKLHLEKQQYGHNSADFASGSGIEGFGGRRAGHGDSSLKTDHGLLRVKQNTK
jgi:hypothetical protein